MIGRIVDKIVFAALFVVALQVPILADHYRQYLSGYFDAMQSEVDGLTKLASSNGYPSVDAMIQALSNNEAQLVRDDAALKQQTLIRYERANTGLSALDTSNYFKQAWYMFQPAQYQTLNRVLANFQPSVPLQPSAIGASFIVALCLNLLVICPVWLTKKVRRKRQQAYI